MSYISTGCFLLSNNEMDDSLMWVAARNGACSVKSGYHFAKGLDNQFSIQRIGSSTLASSKYWKLLWKCFCPPKILLFCRELVLMLWQLGKLASKEDVTLFLCSLCVVKKKKRPLNMPFCCAVMLNWFGSPLSIRIVGIMSPHSMVN